CEGSSLLLPLRKSILKNMTFLSFQQDTHLNLHIYECFHCSMKLMCVLSCAFDLISFPDTSAQMHDESGGPTRQTVVRGSWGEVGRQQMVEVEVFGLERTVDLEELKAEHASYLRQHGELLAMLADFLQFLLLRKPSDVFLFALENFSPFASRRPPGGASTPLLDNTL
ncbi:unnamed protein product, partial [Coregonus sp. 'balchen']